MALKGLVRARYVAEVLLRSGFATCKPRDEEEVASIRCTSSSSRTRVIRVSMRPSLRASTNSTAPAADARSALCRSPCDRQDVLQDVRPVVQRCCRRAARMVPYTDGRSRSSGPSSAGGKLLTTCATSDGPALTNGWPIRCIQQACGGQRLAVSLLQTKKRHLATGRSHASHPEAKPRLTVSHDVPPSQRLPQTLPQVPALRIQPFAREHQCRSVLGATASMMRAPRLRQTHTSKAICRKATFMPRKVRF